MVDTEKNTAANTDENLTFEIALHELETVVSQIEDKKTSLDEAIELFKRGSQLSKVCESKLTDAKERIKQLVSEEEVDLTIPSKD